MGEGGSRHPEVDGIAATSRLTLAPGLAGEVGFQVGDLGFAGAQLGGGDGIARDLEGGPTVRHTAEEAEDALPAGLDPEDVADHVDGPLLGGDGAIGLDRAEEGEGIGIEVLAEMVVALAAHGGREPCEKRAKGCFRGREMGRRGKSFTR